jgi:Domain of unknown function (DUF4407)
MMQREAELSRLTYAACLLVASDPELLARSPLRDRSTVIAEAALLLLVACASGAAWTLFWCQFASIAVGVACGAFAMAFILLLDRAVGSAEWALTGILRRPGRHHGGGYWGRLAIRISITIVLSFATSTGAIMAMDHVAIIRQVEHNRLEQNKQITAYYTGLKTDLRNQSLGPLINEANRIKGIIAENTPLLDTARKAQADAQSQQRIADTEAERELHGHPGYQAGAKTKYRAALKKRQEADTALAAANAEVAIYDPRLTDANKKLDTINASLQAGEETIKPGLEKLESEKQASLIPEGFDALMGYTALQQIYQSPKDGPAALFYSHLMMAVLMTVELAYVVVRLWFSPASICQALQIKETKVEAEAINADYERRSHKIRAELEAEIGPRPARPPLRIINSRTEG